jgi:RHS repeat-associated protein
MVLPNGLKEKRVFDSKGNERVGLSGQRRGGVLTRDFDENRNLAAVHVAGIADGQVSSQDVITIARRSDGQPLTVARPGGGDHAFGYDSLGRRVTESERVDGQWQTTTFEYDLAGNPRARSRPNGMREEFSYDGYGRLTRRAGLRSGTLEGEAIFTHANGSLVAVADSVRGTTELYAYDSAGRRASALFGYGESLTFEYDQRSRLIGETYYWPGQGAIRILGFDYDLANRRTGIRDDGVALIEHQYAGGRLESTHYGNGLERTFSYSAEDGQLAATQTLDAQSQAVETTTITRQGEANPLRYEVTASTITSLASTTEVYWMGIGGGVSDPDRLVGNRVWHWEGGGDSVDFDYDELSNAVSMPTGDQFTYNAERNRLVSATLGAEGETLAYTYDAAGFATSRDGAPITWTATGRMASMGDLTLQWDMLDRPVAWTAGGVTQQFAYFGGRVSANATGGPGTLGLGEVSIELDSAGQRYRHLDFRGNVSFVSDETGAVVTHYRYSPYGLDAVFGSGADAVRFVGRLEVGALMVLGARMYDPVIGRFLSPDPILQLFNQYSYAFGNPVWFIDQDGTEGVSGVNAAGAFANATGILGGVFLVTPGFQEVGVVLVGFAIALWMGIALYYIAEAINGGAGFVGAPISGSGAASGCAPARLTEVGDLGFALKFLVPLQILLAIALAIRQRSRTRRSIRGSLAGWT